MSTKSSQPAKKKVDSTGKVVAYRVPASERAAIRSAGSSARKRLTSGQRRTVSRARRTD